MLKQIIILSLLVIVIKASLIGWQDCGSHFARVHRIRIGDCSHTPCTFLRGQTYLIEVDAESNANSYSLPFAAQALIFGLNVTLFSGDACENLSYGSCPARIGEQFTFSLDFDVPSTLPPIRTVVTTVLLIDSGDVGVCVRVELNIQ